MPRFDTPLDVVRVLGLDRVLLVPRSLGPVAHALVRKAQRSSLSDEERPLYATDDNDRDEVDK